MNLNFFPISVLSHVCLSSSDSIIRSISWMDILCLIYQILDFLLIKNVSEKRSEQDIFGRVSS